MKFSPLAQRIIDWQDEERILREGVNRESTWIINACLDAGGRGWRGMSLRKLAAEVGVSPTYLSQIMHGHSTMSFETFIKLAMWIRSDHDHD